MATQNLLDAGTGVGKVLVSQFLANSETTQYTGPTDSDVVIKTARLCNTSGGAVTVSVSVVATGGTAGSSNRVLSSYSLAAGDGMDLPELKDTCLGEGDFISAIASSSSAVAFVLTGVVFSA